MNSLDFNPTPINVLPYYSKQLGVNLFCKRDDLFAEAGGGSKARMLQYILADVNSSNCEVLLTAGGPCSNFNRACALMCAKLGIQMHLVEYTDEPETFKTSLNYYICKLANVKTTRCVKTEVVETIENILQEYKRSCTKVKYVYGGGKSLEGFFSYYEAVEELYKTGTSVDHLFIACGTGTTLTGVCAGMQKFYPTAKVHAISTARTFEAEKPVLENNIEKINEYLETSYSLSNLEFFDNYLCGGYSKYNDDLFSTIQECISHEGMILDPTYSGKAFWGMKQELIKNSMYKDSNVLFWNTGGIFNLLSENYDQSFK